MNDTKTGDVFHVSQKLGTLRKLENVMGILCEISPLLVEI